MDLRGQKGANGLYCGRGVRVEMRLYLWCVVLLCFQRDGNWITVVGWCLVIGRSLLWVCRIPCNNTSYQSIGPVLKRS